MTVTEIADPIGYFSIFLLWAALIVRARPAWKEHYQRGLWLAILTAATAITLFQPAVIDWAVDASGSTHAVTLSRNLIGVLSAGLTLLFIVDSARGRRMRLIIAAGLASAVATLLFMDLAKGDYPGPHVPSDGGPAAPSATYWGIVCAAHLVTDIVAVIICGHYSQRTDDRDLVWSLRLFAFGSLLAIAFWGAWLVNVYFRMRESLPYLEVVNSIHGVSRALTLLVPVATGTVRLARNTRIVAVLWPMWRDLVAAVPHVALAQPQPTRLHEILRRRAPIALQAHRQTIETYDAILDLQAYVHHQAYQQALQHAQSIRIPPLHAPAAALAGALGQARRAKLAGQAASSPHALPGMDQGDATLLLAIARKWPTMSKALPSTSPPDTSPRDYRATP